MELDCREIKSASLNQLEKRRIIVSKLNREIRIWTAAAVLVAGGMVGGTVVAKTMSHNPAVEEPIFALPAANAAHLGPLTTSYAPIIKGVLPEVVSITSSREVKTSDSMQGSQNDPMFRQFFGDQAPDSQAVPQQQREQGLGSGVIFGTNGYILTNNHVIDGATDVKVDLNDKREFKARIVGRDPKADIAVLKIDADHLPAISMGDSSKAQVGDVVFAIGDPFGVGQTATMGIVSATGRANLGIEDYEDFIQTDAPINPGNSGGALINAQGELIGINTAILSRSGGNQGIGFAIPVNLARHEMEEIVETGHVVRGWLGATIQDVTPALAKGFGLDRVEGVVISDVAPNSPAAKAGLKSGDVVMSINGQPVESSADLRMRISQADPGASVPMSVRRGSSTMDITAKLGELPSDQGSTSTVDSAKSTMSGLEVEGLTAQLREQLHVSSGTQGVAVSQVDPNSAAAAGGVQQGDVIEEVNHHPVANVSEFEQAMHDANGKTILIHVVRGGTGLYLAIEPK
jgi:serine protease Do